jgi:hypothetical protein
MNRNGRTIALGLVAIVLGAGFLLKVIPPETDVGIDEANSFDIDGALVTNPLDLSEGVPPNTPAGLGPQAVVAGPAPQGGVSVSPKTSPKATDAVPDHSPIPPPFAVSVPNDNSSNPNAPRPAGPASPGAGDPPPLGNDSSVPINPLTPNFSGPSTPPVPPESVDSDPDVPEFDDPSFPPDVSLPPGTVPPMIGIDDEDTDSLPREQPNWVEAVPPAPTHHVPESSSTLCLSSAVLAILLTVRSRQSRSGRT